MCLIACNNEGDRTTDGKSGRRIAVRSIGAFIACVFLGLAGVASAQKVVSPPEIAPPPMPLQPPSPSAGETRQPPENEPSTPQKPSATEQRGTENNPVIVKVLPAEKTTEERTQETADHDEKASADWWLIKLTGALVGVRILQLLAFIGQIIVFVVQTQRLRDSVSEMKRATAAAEKAADAARDGADAAKQAARVSEAALTRLERPYLFIASVELSSVSLAALTPLQVSGEPIVEILRVDVSLINHGKTAASVQRMSGCLRIFERLPKIPEYDPARGGLLVIPPEQMGPRQPFSVEITEDVRRRWQNNEVSLFFIGYVIYDDYFDMQHTTGFCARYSRDAGPGWAKAGERAYNYNRSQKIEDSSP
jgi:hypothetical protein